ncbi:MAG TPA: type II secretion system F family protein [Kiritimatiellia bacterium]|nr:type II secretion system F family protein [Kiritimatiellia bacterium]HPR68245.1 type II secretion system F family protein [Kiritimatiellia bacterium]
MARFKFTALDSKGKEVHGEIDADNQSAAVARIREKQYFPTKVEELSGGGGAPARKGAAPKSALQMEIKMPKFLQGGVKTKQLVTFTRQLSTLVNAGLPLMRAMRVLQRQEKNAALRDAVAQMAESIESGSTFAEALAAHPKIFDRLFVNMVKAGEIGGVLDVVLARLAEFQEKAEKIKGKVKSAMTYPIVVLVMAISILTFLMMFIVPKFADIFADLMGGKGMPMLTQFVMNASSVMVHRLPVVVIVIVALVVIIKLLAKTAKGRYALDKFKLNAPVFGTLISKNSISRFTRTLGTLMSSGVPVLQALNIVKETVGNEVISKAVATIHDAVKEGENMAPPIASSKVFPPMVVSMVEVGEETGALPDMLNKIADSYDDDVDNAVAAMTSIIEPVLIIFLAVVVGTIVIALFLPLVSIIGGLSG